MGLFDKLKQATNFVTGGGASVTVTPEKPEFDKTAPIKIKITAHIKDAPLNVAAVYLEIRAREYIAIRTNVDGKDEKINEERTTFTHKVQTAVSALLEGGQSYDWDLELSLPLNAQPTFHGSMAHHVWEVMGSLDIKGNDPDSKWLEINIR